MADVRIRGLRELGRELGRADKRLRKAMGQAHKHVGQRLIVDPAQDRMRAVAKGRGGNLGAEGIKASARTTSLAVILSGSNPRTLGDEFGSIAYRQFRGWGGNQWTGFGGQGYAVHPTIEQNRNRIVDEYEDALWEAVRRAFPD